MNFKDWLKNENMWGDNPSKFRKPSDGWGSTKSSGMPAQQQQQMQQPQMMKKKMKRKLKKK